MSTQARVPAGMVEELPGLYGPAEGSSSIFYRNQGVRRMDRREALGAIAAIPGMASFRVKVNSGDVIVLECPGQISVENANRLRNEFKQAFPRHELIILDNGTRLNVLTGL